MMRQGLNTKLHASFQNFPSIA